MVLNSQCILAVCDFDAAWAAGLIFCGWKLRESWTFIARKSGISLMHPLEM